MTHTARRLTAPSRRAAGFTLVEMVISLAVIAVLLVGMSGAVVLASKALPDRGNAASASVDTARVLHQLRDELSAATHLLERTATSVVLHLPDRDADGRPEVITYAWSGTAGAPLTRSENGSSAVTVLDDVNGLSLAYTTTDLSAVFPGGGSTSGEVELSSHDPGDSTDEFQIKDDNRLGFRFTPALPSNATTWQVTRVLMRTNKSGGAGGEMTFELTGWDAGVGPNSSILESVSMTESDLYLDFGWAQIDFATGGPFNAGDTAAVSLEDTGGGAAGKILWRNNGTPANAHETDNGGTTWSIRDANGAVDHFVFGIYETSGDDWTMTQPHVTAVEIKLVHADAPAVTHRIKVPLPNAPRAAETLWEADFNADPTTLDTADDGDADWQTTGGADFDTTRLDGGRWEITDTLRSNPDDVALDQPFVLDAWIEDTVDNGNGGGVRLRFDRSGALAAYVVVRVNLDSTGQVVTIEAEDAAKNMIEWVNETCPAGHSVRVRLMIDPDNDTVGVMLGDTIMGSYAYERANPDYPWAIRPFTDTNSSGTYLDHLRVSVGGTASITPGAYQTASGAGGTEAATSGGTGGSSESSGGGSWKWWE